MQVVSCFWRDLRRVLFSSSRFRLLCRLGADEIVRDWRPVKLAEVLEGVVPGFEGVINAIPTMLAQVKEQQRDNAPEEPMRDALTAYAIDLCAHYGRDVDEDELRQVARSTSRRVGEAEGLKRRRAAFEELTASLGGRFDFEVDPVVATRLRTAALIESRAIDVGLEEEQETAIGSRQSEERFLDCEIIAIYW